MVATVLRPRVIIYGLILAAMFAAWLTALSLRSNFQVNILRDRNALYRVTPEGDIQNTYQIKLINKSAVEQQYEVEVSGLETVRASWGVATRPEQPTLISPTVGAGDLKTMSLTISVAPSQQVKRTQNIRLIFSETKGDSPDNVSEMTRFWGPEN